jgi:hypothetical protein
VLTQAEEKTEEHDRGLKNMYGFITGMVVGSLRTFLVDNDRVASVCASISTNVITPAFKQQK